MRGQLGRGNKEIGREMGGGTVKQVKTGGRGIQSSALLPVADRAG